jgi:hypothetical protein
MKPVLALVLLLLLAAFFVPLGFPVDAEFWRTLMDVSHLPLFAVIAGICFGLFSSGKGHLLRCRNAFVAAAVLSIAIELLQPLTGRSQSMLDQIYGVTGAAFGAGLLFLWPRRREREIAVVMLLMVLVFSAATAGPAWRKYRVLRVRAQHFPLLGGFENPDEFLLWRPNYYSFTGVGRYDWETNFVTQGAFALNVDASTGGWPGVDFDAGEQDWSGYDALEYDLYNPGSDFILRMRIDDDGDCSRYGKRFDHELSVIGGWNHIAIPMAEIRTSPHARELNLKAIRRVLIFISIADGPRRFFLDNVRLTREMTQ